MDRKVLGRGLDVLIPQDAQGMKERVQTLPLNQILPSRFQPRLSYSETKIEELAQSIKEKGIIQPIIVRIVGLNSYELIAGERRLRAIKKLGLTEVPAIVRKVEDSDVLEMAIIENVQREDLNPLDEAKAYRRLAEEFGFTQDAIAQRVGKDKSSVSNLLRILALPDKIQDYLSQSLISFGHARALLALADSRKQLELCEQVVKRGLSVRQVEQFSTRKSLRNAKRVASFDHNIRALEERLQHRLGTKVKIRHKTKRGSIEIEYFSLEDLDRVLNLMGC